MTRPGWWILSSFLCLTLVLGCAKGEGEEDRFAPAEIHGVWTTSNPTYADRSFEIRAQDLVFDTGEEGIVVYPIISVRRESTQEGVDFEIDHQGLDGGTFTFTFSFTFDPTAGSIVFRNQPQMTWLRASPGG